jgi:hypothetical protein
MPDDKTRIAGQAFHDPPAAAQARCARDRSERDPAAAHAQWLELIRTLARECARRDHDTESRDTPPD